MGIQKTKWVATIFSSVLFLIFYLHTNNISFQITQSQIHLDIPSDSDNGTSLTQITVVILILSTPTPDSKDLRHNLRTKWLNQSYWRDEEFDDLEGINVKQLMNVKFMFVLGKPRYGNFSKEFMDEVSLNKDMHLTNKIENKYFLKDKVLWGMRESVKHHQYDYLIKIDHDTLVDLPHLSKRIRGLKKNNLYTGSCDNLMRRGAETAILYCQGGAYILSQDLVEKIASLSDNETKITLGGQEPEDAYTGWLVTQIQKKFKIPRLRPTHNRHIVSKVTTGRYRYQFDKWFYHWIKGRLDMEKAFECRIKHNLTHCPSARYDYKNSSSPTCDCEGRD